MQSFRRVLLATTELWDRPSKLLRALFLKLRAKTMVFILMNALLVDTRRKWCMLSSELHSVRSLRRFPSVGTEYAAVVSRTSVAQQYPYIGSCINVRQTCTRSFSFVRFTQLKKKCLQKLVLSPTSAHYWLIAMRAPPVAMVRVWLWAATMNKVWIIIHLGHS